MSALLTDALTTLENWLAPTLDQERLRASYVERLRAHPEAVFRSAYPDHLTASALVLTPDRSRVLLTLHRKARQWYQFGGHLEPADKGLAAAAVREATEESGVLGLSLEPGPVHLDRHSVPFCDPRGGVRHLDVRYLLTAPEEVAHVVGEESLDVRWWPVGDLPTDERSIHELVRVALG